MLRSSFVIFICGWVVWFMLDKPGAVQFSFPERSDDLLGNFQYAFDMLKAGYPQLAFIFIWKQHYIVLSLLCGALLAVSAGALGDFLGRRRITTTGSLFYIEETRESFESLRRGGQLEMQRLGDHSRTGILFDYRLVDLIRDDTQTDPPVVPNGPDGPDQDVTVVAEDMEIAPRDLQEIEIASLTPGWLLDHRNNPVNATPSPSIKIDRADRRYSLTNIITKTANKARNPGISLTD